MYGDSPTQEIPLLVMGGLVDEIVFTRRFLLGLGDGAENAVSGDKCKRHA